MATYLIATVDAGGNVPPAAGIAAELVCRGHRVVILGQPAQAARVASTGAEFVPYRTAPPWDPTAPATALAAIRGMNALFTDRGIGREVVAAARATGADATMIDCMLLGVCAEVDDAGLPHAVLFHTFVGFFDGVFCHGPMGIGGTLRGTPPRRRWRAAQARIAATDSVLDPYRGDRSRIEYCGIVDPAGTPLPAVPADGPPLVLLSFSTNAMPGQREAYQRVLDACAGEDCRLLVTVGDAVPPDSLTRPPNAEVVRFVPHSDVLPQCAAVICHGGHSTTFRALAHGLPTLVLPMHPLIDQPMVGQAVARSGAGLTLPRSARPDRIAAAVRALLTDRSMRAAARDVAARLALADGAGSAAMVIERIGALPVTPGGG